jgi:hypothetical protein
VVFTSLPLNIRQTNDITQLVAPANLTFVVDHPGLQQMFDNMTDSSWQDLANRCHVTSKSEIHSGKQCVTTRARVKTHYNTTGRPSFR